VLANGAMVAVLLALLDFSESWMLGHWWERAVYLSSVCLLGLLVYVGTLLMSGVRPRDFSVKLNS